MACPQNPINTQQSTTKVLLHNYLIPFQIQQLTSGWKNRLYFSSRSSNSTLFLESRVHITMFSTSESWSSRILSENRQTIGIHQNALLFYYLSVKILEWFNSYSVPILLIFSRVPDQNGVSQAWYIVENHHSGWKPLFWLYKMFENIETS